MSSAITIITICFNNLDELITTCKSIDVQTKLPHEHLIINGSTEPDIKNYLAQHEQPVYRRWLNERDRGIGDAFNKGVLQSSGNILVMLNAGDSLYDKHVLEKVINAFQKHQDIQWLHAKYELLRGDQRVIIGKPFSAAKIYRGMRSISHQTMYVRREMYEKHGLYDINLKIAVDYDFLIRIKDETFYFLPESIASFAPGGISSTRYLKSLRESSMVYRKYFGMTWMHAIWQWRLKLLHYILKSPVGNLLYRIKVKLKLENL